MDGSAVRINRADDVAIHLGKSALKIGRQHGGDQGIAFVATYLHLISRNDAEQAAAAFGITEVRMWNDGAVLAFRARPATPVRVPESAAATAPRTGFGARVNRVKTAPTRQSAITSECLYTEGSSAVPPLRGLAVTFFWRLVL
jgi:hypothetical protein